MAIQSQPKLCVDCGKDCADTKRVKDRQGRYHCQDCVDARAAKRAADRPATAPIPVAGADALPIEIDPVDPTPVGTNELCAGCGMPRSSNAIVCLGCGFNHRSGRFTSEELAAAQDPDKPVKKKKYLCRNCEYDLTGLAGARCPECGTINTRETGKLDREKLRRDIVRNAYLQPVIVGAIGLVGLGIGAVATQSLQDLGWWALWLGFCAIFGTGVYFLYCLMWSGFDMPMHMAMMRLFAVYCVCAAVDTLGTYYLIAPVAWALSAVVSLGLLYKMLELDDIKDALLLMFFLRLSSLAAWFASFFIMVRFFGYQIK